MLLYGYRNSGPADGGSAKLSGRRYFILLPDRLNKLCTVFSQTCGIRVVFPQMFMGTAVEMSGKLTRIEWMIPS